MAYAYLVVTIDTTANPPRVLRSGVHAGGAAVQTPVPGRFQMDVMMASGRDFALAKHNLFTNSKLEPYYSRAVWAFRLLPADDLKAWQETPSR